VKRYVLESGSSTVGQLISEGISITSRLSAPEIASALARRHREGDLKTTDRDRLMNLMERDIASLNVVEISAEVSALACRLLMKHKLPAGDALHLASALLVTGRADVGCQFIAFDANLNDAAKQEGLEVLTLG
jgi:predicted nucleic acid-binding protein